MTLDLSDLAENFKSAIIPRSKIEEFTGGLFTSAYMANLDSIGQGPPRFRVGRKICYKTADLIAWLQARSKKI